MTDSSKAWFRDLYLRHRLHKGPTGATETINDEITQLTREDLDPLSDLLTADDAPRFATLEFLGPWFPEADPNHTKAQTWRIWWSKRETILRGYSIIAALVLVANLASAIFFKLRWKPRKDIGTMYRGECTVAQGLNSWLHIAINVLSTALLGVSNSCMQLLAAPTRREIDEAHDRHSWLDIGVPSFRNIWHISTWRRIVIFLLAASSIPLHFL